ncbi:MAG: WecB/TagA/CpsF family glycosyltransferase [Pararhizobium sp.]
MQVAEQNSHAMPIARIGGLPVVAIDRETAAASMIRAARSAERGRRPLYFTSVNGEVVARARRDADLDAMIRSSDQILADGQPLVFASRFLCRTALPERVATTDLFHDVARIAEESGETFYLFGATEEENRRAVARARALHPKLRIVGASHGYLRGAALLAKLDEINALAPDILWLGLGVPLEQKFVHDFSDRLTNVGVIKTSGGLFNHLSGKNRRAPGWMQAAGFEWLWRALIEPRRLFWRYLTTNPAALYAILRYSE